MAAEDFAGFETNVQKVNFAAVNLTDSPLATLLERWHTRHAGR